MSLVSEWRARHEVSFVCICFMFYIEGHAHKHTLIIHTKKNDKDNGKSKYLNANMLM